MKFRFVSSDKEYDLPTKTPTITKDEFIKLLHIFLFKEKDPSCSFKIINLQEKQCLNCSTDVPLIKKCFAQIFNQPKKLELVDHTKTKKQSKSKRRWRSRSPKKKRRKRWRSPSSERV